MFGILIPLLVGIAYGYFAKGKQDKGHLFKVGAIFALILAFVLNAIGWFTGRDPTTGADNVSFWGILISTLISLVIFLVGVWLGDMIEGRRHRGSMTNTGRTL